MVANDLQQAKQHALLKANGFDVAISLEAIYDREEHH